MSNKGGIIGGIITLAIGGTLYKVNQAAIVENFSKDTGMSQQQAEQYVKNISEDDIVPFDEVGKEFVSEGEDILKVANETDCSEYTYEWETKTLTCEKGKAQLKKLGDDEIALGRAYIALASETASEEDIKATIGRIDKLNSDYSSMEVVSRILDSATIEESMNTNSYNKALLKAALESKD